MKIHENIKKLRTDLNLTQTEVADKLFVTRQCISRWEQGITVPDIESIEKLSVIFGCTVNDIFEDQALKALTIKTAKESHTYKHFLYVFAGISLIVFVTLGVISFLTNQRINAQVKVDDSLKYVNAFIKTIDDESETLLLSIKYENSVDTGYDLTLDLKSDFDGVITNNTYSLGMGFDQLAVDDILIIEYRIEISPKTIERIIIVDHKVEKSLLGFIVVTNGKTYTSYDDVYQNKEDKGLRYALYQASPSGFSFSSNIGYQNHQNLETDTALYNTYNLIRNFRHDDFNVYFDPNIDTHFPKIGIIYNTGIEYQTNTRMDTYLKGEIDYDDLTFPYTYHSMEIWFNIHLIEKDSVSQFIIYEYDANHTLIKTTTITDLTTMNAFTIHYDALYSYIKVYDTKAYEGAPDDFVVYHLMAGESINLWLSDIHGMNYLDTFRYE